MKRAKVNPGEDDVYDGLPPILARACPWLNDPVLRRLQPKGMPLLFGNEDFEMGESNVHTITASILFYGLRYHFASLAAYRVFANLNLYYSPDDRTEYVSPDVMVVQPSRTLPVDLASYRIGEEGPAPFLVGEVLSFRTWQQGDMQTKPTLYARLGVEEYIVVDVTGAMLEQRLALLLPQPGGSWRQEQDPDGGITSRLGFRIVIEEDGQLRVIDAKTGKRYARPDEAQAAADELAAAEERILALEEELARLRGELPKDKKGKGRRRKS
jgi:Uma2 family endonuclease